MPSLTLALVRLSSSPEKSPALRASSVIPLEVPAPCSLCYEVSDGMYVVDVELLQSAEHHEAFRPAHLVRTQIMRLLKMLFEVSVVFIVDVLAFVGAKVTVHMNL